MNVFIFFFSHGAFTFGTSARETESVARLRHQSEARITRRHYCYDSFDNDPYLKFERYCRTVGSMIYVVDR